MPQLSVERLGLIDYQECHTLMQSKALALADARSARKSTSSETLTATTTKPTSSAHSSGAADLLLCCEHPGVYTQGIASKAEHVLTQTLPYPVVQTKRGGQVTWHGPGQLVVYPIYDLIRLGWGVRTLVSSTEQALVSALSDFVPSKLRCAADPKAPGVYVYQGQTKLGKVASLGFKVTKGVSFHGLSVNLNADLSAFDYINPCGFSGLTMLNLNELSSQPVDFEEFTQRLIEALKLAHKDQVLTGACL